MEKIAIIFPGIDGLSEPEDPWVDEYSVCSSSNLFDPIFFDKKTLIEDHSLKISRPAQTKKQYCYFRTTIDTPFKNDIYFHALKRAGYYPTFSDLFDYHGPAGSLGWYGDKLQLFPQHVNPFIWTRSDLRLEMELQLGTSEDMSTTPFVAKNSHKTLRNADSSVHLFSRRLEREEGDKIEHLLCDYGIDTYVGNGSYRESSVWYEEFLDIQVLNDVPIEWRIFVYRGRILYKCPKFLASSKTALPEPPKEILDSIATDGFRAFDLALTSDGSWKILKVKRGEQARVPIGGSVVDFYTALEYGLTHEPEIPDWVWCPVGRIAELHCIGEDNVRVRGSKDFAAGTKVYMVNAFWGEGGERCLVLGVPKYSNKIIGTIIKTSLICDWELERVTDKVVLRAMFTNRLSEDFERPRETDLYGCWGQSDEDKKSILGLVDFNNQIDTNRKR